jgi:hypothetical protein
MTAQGEIFMPDEEVVFRGRPMRVAGRVQLEGSSGQLTFRYLLSDPTGAPVILEEGEGRYAQLRSFPAASQPRTANNTVSVGPEKYTLVGVRKLTVLDVSGNAPGVALKASLIVSGIFEGPMGTLMRELVPGTDTQVYYLVKPLAPGEVVSAAKFNADREAEGRAAGERALDKD